MVMVPVALWWLLWLCGASVVVVAVTVALWWPFGDGCCSCVVALWGLCVSPVVGSGGHAWHTIIPRWER